MNRLELDTDSIFFSKASVNPKAVPDVVTRKRSCETLLRDIPLATFTPIHYEANYAYPLVVWLHGSASNEHELRQVMPLLSMRNYVAVAPRGTWEDPRYSGRYNWRQTSDDIDTAETHITHCLEIVQQRFHIHTSRVFLVGHESGGTMALRLAWNAPQNYAGVVAINGPLPAQLRPFRHINELRRVPCLLATSRDSCRYPASRVCRDLRLLHAAGCTVALRQYPGGDGLTTKMLSDLDCWLMELVCGAKRKDQL